MTFELFSADGTNLIFLKRNLTISKTIYGSICTFGPGISTLGNVIQGNNFKRTLYKNVHSSTIIMVKKKFKTIQVEDWYSILTGENTIQPLKIKDSDTINT